MYFLTIIKYYNKENKTETANEHTTQSNLLE